MIVPVWAREAFDDRIQPILKTSCLPCHDEKTRTSGFSIKDLESVLAGGARHGAAVKAGRPEESPLVRLLRGTIKPQMPLGQALAENEIVAIEEWIRGLKPESGVSSESGKPVNWVMDQLWAGESKPESAGLCRNPGFARSAS